MNNQQKTVTTETPRHPDRLSFLDCIRGVAALAVLVEHIGALLWPRFHVFVHNSFNFGKFGVAAFFLTSGFVIPFSLERGNSLPKFWISRFFRLYPLYWLSLTMVVCLFLLGVPHGFGPDFSSHLARNVLVNVTMFQQFVGIPHAEGLYYTLSMEMALYVFLSILFFRKRNHLSLLIAWVASAALAAVGILIPLLAQKRIPMAGLFYFLCFFVGTCVYRHFTGHVSANALVGLLTFVSVSTFAEIYCNYVVVKKEDVNELFTLWAVLLPWSAAYCVFLLAYFFRAHKFPTVFVWLGAISYSVYLFHPAVARIVFLVPLPPVFSFLAVLAAAILTATVTYRFVEQPFIRFGKKLQNHITNARSPVPAGSGDLAPRFPLTYFQSEAPKAEMPK
jgi:peptidoglycan/LPS O-acetylase OafA/YrhL